MVRLPSSSTSEGWEQCHLLIGTMGRPHEHPNEYPRVTCKNVKAALGAWPPGRFLCPASLLQSLSPTSVAWLPS